MGWLAITKGGEILREDSHGRPVQAGEEGNLLVIAQEDYGRTVAVDLVNGIIAIDYEHLGVQNGTVELAGDKFRFLICDETNIVSEFQHLERKFEFARDDDGKKILHEGKFVKVRTDVLTPLTWRPIWFTRHTTGAAPVKVIGAQVTLPKDMQGGKNVKKMVSIFESGIIGID